jgi:hypothetical protein
MVHVNTRRIDVLTDTGIAWMKREVEGRTDRGMIEEETISS